LDQDICIVVLGCLPIAFNNVKRIKIAKVIGVLFCLAEDIIYTVMWRALELCPFTYVVDRVISFVFGAEYFSTILLDTY
jgi:hypothetical protein